ncbi:MAG: bifunctional allantoicase/(S)-ureidoglycine aminohydrolase [Aestuariivita sp.]|nr:bifunctional allantoicase/(S)-ureidoglycine aminohydrolase [Aestuariivita sp.]
MKYAFPKGGLPGQDEHPISSAIFKNAYACLPAATHRDIVTSYFPQWSRTRAWIFARPLSGFAETFAQYAIEIAPEGGSDSPDPDKTAQSILFVASGKGSLNINKEQYTIVAGSYAYIPAGATWTLHNADNSLLQIHWVRKTWEPAPGLKPPNAFVTHEEEHKAQAMPDCGGVWATTRFVDPDDLRHDCHVNIVTLQPGGRIPFAETHVMEHGLYVLQGTADYLLNTDWVSVSSGDFMWLRAFCPQACIATGKEPFRYLLYKDVNRHPKL